MILDQLATQDAFDAYLDYAARIPTQVMLDLLGLPDSDEANCGIGAIAVPISCFSRFPPTKKRWRRSNEKFSTPSRPTSCH